MSRPDLHHASQRLLTQGASHLSDADLLGVVLGSFALARSIARASSRWTELGRADLLSLPRVRPARGAQLLALAELTRRLAARPVTTGDAIMCASDVAASYGPRLGHEQQEVFLALALDAKHHVIAEHEVARGTLTSVEVHPRELFRALVRDGAAAALLVHNHPSGDPEPSREDRLLCALCARLVEAGQLLGIAVLDFVIVGGRDAVSFAERRCLPGGAE